jgi:hypothetical protein
MASMQVEAGLDPVALFSELLAGREVAGDR